MNSSREKYWREAGERTDTKQKTSPIKVAPSELLTSTTGEGREAGMLQILYKGKCGPVRSMSDL